LTGSWPTRGPGHFGGVLEITGEAWQEQFDVKVRSVLHLVKPSLAALRESDAGRVVIVNGVTAHAPEPGMAAVSAARAAYDAWCAAEVAHTVGVLLGRYG
jgi:NAD(P)-dependent dehydrogenase (short-subunit alcohol dehydrogenase family)